jgi:GNAT superfamily N-acetyltransferase
MLKFHRLTGQEARAHTNALAELRLQIFWEYPYLYEGDLSYEKKYLETYFKAEHSFILLVEDNHKIVGATTGIWAKEEEESFRKPFEDHGYHPEKVFYFGESVLLPEYRGKGLGKKFFEEREAYARTLHFIKFLSFCAVERGENHLLRPKDHRPLDIFWKQMGFSKVENLKTQYEWKDRGEDQQTKKEMQYWMKNI